MNSIRRACESFVGFGLRFMRVDTTETEKESCYCENRG